MASSALHAAFGALEMPAEPCREPHGQAVSALEFTVQTDVVRSAHGVPALQAELERRKAPSQPRQARARVEGVRPAQELPAQAQDQDASQARASIAPSREPSTVATVDLSPSAAARSLIDVRAASGAMHVRDAASTKSTASKSDSSADLTNYLARAAGNKALSRADDPLLEQTPEGYAFSGNGFRARIDRDGSVHFLDRYVSGTNFDLTAWAEHMAGNDPYRSERRWFLERTAALRDQLAHALLRERLHQAETEVATKLQTIWSDPEKSLARQKFETFELWDECSDDEIGLRCREIVEAYVAEHCPLGSVCAVTAEDLSVFNAQRRTRAAFAPYQRRSAPVPL